MQGEMDLFFELTYGNLEHGLFMRRVIEEARPWVGKWEWATDEEKFADKLDGLHGAETLLRKQEPSAESAVFYLEGSLVFLENDQGEVLLRIAGVKEESTRIKARLKALLPEADESSRVRLNFWYWASTRGFPLRTRRLLTVPSWSEISINYPQRTRSQLERLIRDGLHSEAGKLVLWFGDPGCGKTYALRSLLREWKDRFSIHYISDAEKFFAYGDYMIPVLLDEGNTQKLLILEDAGEFLLPDARQEMGQGLARLLNASDGLIGQGLQSTFLITTNEEVDRLHPALSRPGRCAAQLQFGAFNPHESRDWLLARGRPDLEAPAGSRLADLYALCRGDEVGPSRRPRVGFSSIESDQGPPEELSATTHDGKKEAGVHAL